MCFLPALAAAAGVPATIVQPVNGAVDADPSQRIQWTAQNSALAYYLYVGTTAGAKDLIDSHETQAMSWPAHMLPVGTQLFARIHTKYADGWVSSDASFTLRAAAVFTTPGSTTNEIAPDVVFRWTAVTGAQAYYLYVGSTPGAKDLIDSGERQTTEFQANLPPARTVYARLHTLHGGVWSSVERTLNVRAVSTFLHPVAGDNAVNPSSLVRWRPVDGATAYYLYLGSQPGRKDLLDTGATTRTEWPLTHVPAGQLIHARLYTFHGGIWRYVEQSFHLLPMAVFLEPESNGSDVDPRAPLAWTSVETADAYYLYVGSTPGSKDLIDTGEIQALSWPVDALPRTQLLYARLFTNAEGAWRYVDRSFRIKPVATLMAPTDGSESYDIGQPLRWTQVENAQAYYLYVGTSRGAKDLINSREITATSFAISSLPPDQLVYVRLHTKHGGVWRYVDETIRTKTIAHLTGSIVTTGILQADEPLNWNASAGAESYYVYIGSQRGLKDLADSGEIETTSFKIPERDAHKFASDATVYVRLHTLVDGEWSYVDYEVQLRGKSLLTLPLRTSIHIDVSNVTFKWTAVPGAQAYYLYVGTAQGAKDVLSSGETQALERTAATLPGGRTLHVRLWTKLNGAWRFADSTFTTRPAAAFIYPKHGQLSAQTNRNFEWTAVQGALKYRVDFGTTPGGTDLHQSGELTSTSLTPPSLPTTGIIYGRLWTLVNGSWWFSDVIFTQESSVSVPLMIWSSGSSSFIAREALQWQAASLAAAYRLKIGTTPGGTDLHDSSWIRSVRRLVPDLPTAVPLHGTLEVKFLNGMLRTRAFTFTVTNASITFEDRWNLALEATAAVRGMATASNYPFPNSILTDAVRDQGRITAFCTAYTKALLHLLEAENLGLTARGLDVCLNPNRFDCHTLAEALNPDTGRWGILDPTFGISAKRASDGVWATAVDLFEATQAGTFESIEYVPLTDADMAYAHGYYLDYPILYAHVLAPGSNENYLGSVDSVLSYFEPVGSDVVSTAGFYAIRCPEGSDEVPILMTGSSWIPRENGVAIVPCAPGIDRMSPVFSASEISSAGFDYQIYRPRRFVFPSD